MFLLDDFLYRNHFGEMAVGSGNGLMLLLNHSIFLEDRIDAVLKQVDHNSNVDGSVLYALMDDGQQVSCRFLLFLFSCAKSIKSNESDKSSSFNVLMTCPYSIAKVVV
eukprot:scaffold1973_cov72-Cylindrotheca_fusiformis.AAC.3